MAIKLKIWRLLKLENAGNYCGIGIFRVIIVPWPGLESTMNFPFILAILARICVRPKPSIFCDFAVSKPFPLSLMEI